MLSKKPSICLVLKKNVFLIQTNDGRNQADQFCSLVSHLLEDAPGDSHEKHTVENKLNQSKDKLFPCNICKKKCVLKVHLEQQKFSLKWCKGPVVQRIFKPSLN